MAVNPDDRRHASRSTLRVELPCGTCIHQGICLIEEQLEQDITLRIGVEDARTRLVDGGVTQALELRIDCSWYDDRPIKPKGSGKLRRPRKPRPPMTEEQLAAARDRMRWAREHRGPKPAAEDAA